MAALPRPLAPHLNAPGLMAAAGAVYAAAVMCYNAHYHHGVISVPVIIAGVAAVGSLLTRFVVTPVADPRDGAGRPLVPAPPPPPLSSCVPLAPLPRPRYQSPACHVNNRMLTALLKNGNRRSVHW